MKYQYPGNIRELENVIEYGFILCPGGFIQLEHLPDSFSKREELQDTQPLLTSEGLALEEIEKMAIEASLKRNKWRRMATCKELGINKDTLRRKIEKYRISIPTHWE
jgi:transcriptional regulator with PAS, ATPase and Fis domain